MKLFVIDPGNAQSAFVVVDENYTIYYKEKNENQAVLEWMQGFHPDKVVIEKIASYGMAVGREVFDTCIWIGRFTQAAIALGIPIEYIFRHEEKLAICHSPNAGDTNIRRALIDRFAKHDLKNGKGTKKNPDFFYGFKADIWAAFAVAVTFLDKTNTER